MKRWQNRIAVVTGASSGIGAAIAKDLVQAGMIVVGLARRKERMDELGAALAAPLRAHFHAIHCDVSDVQSVNRAFDWIEANLGGVDVLINNAGVQKFGQLLTNDLPVMEQVLQTNVMGIIYCTRRAYQSMRARQIDGHVVMLNSIIGHHILSTPTGEIAPFNMYGVSKYAVTAMTEVLRQEFRGFGTKIKITSISPGVVDTEMLPDACKHKFPMLQSQDISQSVLYVLSTPPHVQVHELTIRPIAEPF